MNRIIVITIITLMFLIFPGVLMSENQDADSWYRKGLQVQNLNQKISLYNKALRLDPKNPRIHNSLGIVYIRKGLYDQAISHLRTAVKIDNNFLHAYINLAIATRSMGNPKKSISIYDQVLSIEPNSVIALFNQAIAYENIKEYSKAIENYLKAVNLDPDNYKVWLNLGVAYYRSGQNDRGIQILLTLIDKYPNYGKAHYDIGMIYHSMKKLSEARYHFTKASDLGIQVPRTYLGDEKSSGGEPSKPTYEKWTPPTPLPTAFPKTDYQEPTPTGDSDTLIPEDETQITETEPAAQEPDQDYYFETTPETGESQPVQEIRKNIIPESESSQQQETDEPAAEIIVERFETVPSNEEYPSRYWYQKALSEQEPDKREYFLLRALKAQPDFAPAMLELANYYLERAQQYDKIRDPKNAQKIAQKAAEQYEKLLQIDPNSPKIYLNLGVIYAYYVTDKEKAIIFWEKFLQVSPDSDRSNQIRKELKKLRKK